MYLQFRKNPYETKTRANRHISLVFMHSILNFVVLCHISRYILMYLLRGIYKVLHLTYWNMVLSAICHTWYYFHFSTPVESISI